eukprot:872915-Prorocentrum_minimum.AAC.1
MPDSCMCLCTQSLVAHLKPRAAGADGPFSVRCLVPVDVHRVNDHVSIPIHRDVGCVLAVNQ